MVFPNARMKKIHEMEVVYFLEYPILFYYKLLFQIALPYNQLQSQSSYAANIVDQPPKPGLT